MHIRDVMINRLVVIFVIAMQFSRIAIDQSVFTELVYIELRHLDVCHFVNEECRHLSNGCKSNVVASVIVPQTQHLRQFKETSDKLNVHQSCPLLVEQDGLARTVY